MNSTLEAHRTAVLFIDFQVDVCARGGLMLSQDEAVIARFEATRAAAGALLERIRGDDPRPHVVHMTHGFEPGYPELRGVRHNKMSSYVQSSGAFIKGAAGSAIVPELAAREDEAQLWKQGISAFTGGSLLPYLVRRSVDTVVICGVVTHYAVLATSLAANDLGFHVIVPRDTCTSGSPERHQLALDVLAPLVDVVDSDAVRFG